MSSACEMIHEGVVGVEGYPCLAGTRGAVCTLTLGQRDAWKENRVELSMLRLHTFIVTLSLLRSSAL